MVTSIPEWGESQNMVENGDPDEVEWRGWLQKTKSNLNYNAQLLLGKPSGPQDSESPIKRSLDSKS
jgi:hypothetical protein